VARAGDAVERLVRALVAALNARDLDRLIALYAEDAVLEFPGSRPVRGRPAIRAAYARYFREWQEEVVLTRLVVTGERAVAEGVAAGRHRAVHVRIAGRVPIPLRGYRHGFSASWEVRDGKIRRHRVSYDPGDLVRQLLDS
jgi:uncharacterized protein (TIGR02246 family)